MHVGDACQWQNYRADLYKRRNGALTANNDQNFNPLPISFELGSKYCLYEL